VFMIIGRQGLARLPRCTRFSRTTGKINIV